MITSLIICLTAPIIAIYFTFKRQRTARLRLSAVQTFRMHYSRGDYLSALHIAESMKGNSMLAHFFAGGMHMNLGNLQEAERQLHQNLTEGVNGHERAMVFSLMGQVLLELRRYDEAVECFQASLQHWPELGSSYRALAEACLREGSQTADAVKWCKLAVEKDRMILAAVKSSALNNAGNSNLAEDLATLAWAVAADSGDRAEVERLVSEAESFSFDVVSSKALVQCHAGQAFLAMGDPGSGDRHFSEAARVDPNGLWGRAGLAGLSNDARMSR